MTVFIDDIALYPGEAIDPRAKMYKNRWSHLWTDEKTKVLHDFAASIGLRKNWFQNKKDFPHYDIVPSKREEAIKKGAVCVSLKEWLKKKK